MKQLKEDKLLNKELPQEIRKFPIFKNKFHSQLLSIISLNLLRSKNSSTKKKRLNLSKKGKLL